MVWVPRAPQRRAAKEKERGDDVASREWLLMLAFKTAASWRSARWVVQPNKRLTQPGGW